MLFLNKKQRSKVGDKLRAFCKVRNEILERWKIGRVSVIRFELVLVMFITWRIR